MKLWYISMNLDDLSLGIEGKKPRIAFASEFAYRHRFISNYLTREIRKVRFETDGTFNMISVRFSRNPNGSPLIVPFNALEADIYFDPDEYRLLTPTKEIEYCLDAFEAGFERAAGFKKIPLATLLSLIDGFRRDDYKNEWTHKTKRSKSLGIKVILNCFLTSTEFRLEMSVAGILPDENLCSGLLLRTKPDEIFFEKEFKDILITEEKIIVTDFLDRPRFVVDARAAFLKEFRLLE